MASLPDYRPRSCSHLGMIRSTVFLGLISCFLANPLGGTTVIAALAHDAVYMASDSNVTYTGRPPDDAPRKICKILQVRRYFFAAASLNTDSKTGFSLQSLAIKALETRGLLRDRVQSFNDIIEPELRVALSTFRSESVGEYEERVVGKDIVQATFAAWENDQPVLIKIVWHVAPTGELTSNTTFATEAANTFLLGHYTVARAYLEHSNLLARPPEENLRLAVQAQIDSMTSMADPPSGPPITVLRITKDGPSWHGQGLCPDLVK